MTDSHLCDARSRRGGILFQGRHGISPNDGILFASEDFFEALQLDITQRS
jgi:hypothetical protein